MIRAGARTFRGDTAPDDPTGSASAADSTCRARPQRRSWDAPGPERRDTGVAGFLLLQWRLP